MTPWDSSWPPGSRIPADGLRARSRRGAFATTWWGRRFTDAVEAAAGTGRLSRGRTYARQGQVVSLEVGAPGSRDAGTVHASVQGSRPRPYAVDLAFSTWDHETQTELADALAADPGALAAVLGGVLPESFEQLCLGAGLVLLPASLSDLRAGCTCPDLVEPCKHAAAVVYLLAERLDTDPFTVLALRGVDAGRLLSLVAARRAGAGAPAGTGVGTGGGSGVTGLPAPLPAGPEFWTAGPLPPPPAVGLPVGVGALDGLDASHLGARAEAVAAAVRPLLAAMARP